MALRRVIQTEKEIDASLDRICEQLFGRHPQLNEMVLVGIRTGGIFLAERLKRKILQKGSVDLPMGMIDITFYRDDWTRLSQTPEVKKQRSTFPLKIGMSFW